MGTKVLEQKGFLNIKDKKMKKRSCDLCKNEIILCCGVSFDKYDLCDRCVKLARVAICTYCNGTGIKRVVGRQATLNIQCDKCK